MRYFRIIYEKKDVRQVWVKIPDEDITPGLGELAAEHIAIQEFWNDFERWDAESDDCNNSDNSTNVLTVDEIDENGEDI